MTKWQETRQNWSVRVTTHRDWRTILQSGLIESGPSTLAPSLVTVIISNWIMGREREKDNLLNIQKEQF